MEMTESANVQWKEIHQPDTNNDQWNIRSIRTDDDSASLNPVIFHDIEGDESVTTGSVSGSWTGRMRPLQAAEAEGTGDNIVNKRDKNLDIFMGNVRII